MKLIEILALINKAETSVSNTVKQQITKPDHLNYIIIFLSIIALLFLISIMFKKEEKNKN